MRVSVIVSTYNWPEALGAVLRSLVDQSIAPYEVIVADDGSGSETKSVVNAFDGVRHVWHSDDGFRLAEIRNKALIEASGDWVVFLDGDCVCPPWFIEQQIRLADESKMLAGNRRLLTPSESESFLKHQRTVNEFVRESGAKKLGVWPGVFYRDWMPKKWQKVRGCNIGVFRSAALAIGGFDESYQGWGKEDSDFAARAINAGLNIRLGQHAVSVLHLYHPEADRSALENNEARLADVLATNRTKPVRSLLTR